MFPNFHGNSAAASTLERMAASRKISQAILLAGPEGIGKATLARRFAALLLGGGNQTEADDLSLEPNTALIAEREKWPAEKRNEDPLLFASHPDFITFAPDGPLRQISIQQMRLLKERAQFRPLRGERRVFLVDRIDRANEQAANSLLKTLEEPPEYLILLASAVNPQDLLPTIRSRAVTLNLFPLNAAEMRGFLEGRGLSAPERRLALAEGSPGLAASIDLEIYDQRRAAMLTLLETAAGRAPFAEWAKHSEALGARKTEKLEELMQVLGVLLEDVLRLANGITEIRNPDLRNELAKLAGSTTFPWVRAATARASEISEFARRNIQKAIALDSFAAELRALALGASNAA